MKKSQAAYKPGAALLAEVKEWKEEMYGMELTLHEELTFRLYEECLSRGRTIAKLTRKLEALQGGAPS